MKSKEEFISEKLVPEHALGDAESLLIALMAAVAKSGGRLVLDPKDLVAMVTLDFKVSIDDEHRMILEVHPPDTVRELAHDST